MENIKFPMSNEKFVETFAIDRKGTDSYKWDRLDKMFGDSDLISMWVADMEFKTVPEIQAALHNKIDHGVYGYSFPNDAYYVAFSEWMTRHHGFPIEKDWVRFAHGVVPAVYWMINAFTNPGDACMILTPVYYPFHDAVKNTGRELVTVDLMNDQGYFSMDFEAIESAIIEKQVKLFVQCSPHNPVGRVWTENELDQVMALCQKHGVLVVSDEIHQDIIIGDKKFIPAANVSGGGYRNNLITLSAASKTFNLAGLVHANIIISDEHLRATYDDYAKQIHPSELNMLGIAATMAGYQHGDPWLNSLREVIKANYDYVKLELEKAIPKIVISPLEGTYLLFIDLRQCMAPEAVKSFIQDRCRMAVDYGEWFGEGYQGFIRLNLATDPKYVKLAVTNIKEEIVK